MTAGPWYGSCLAAENPLKRHMLEDKEAHWQIMANTMTYDQKKGLYRAEGDVIITRNGQTLTAQKGIYNENTGIVQVTGDVRLTSNGDILEGEMGIIDLNNHFGQINNGTLFLRENNFYVKGSSMVRIGPNTYRIKNYQLTTCDGKKPAWSITGSEINVTVEGYGSIKDATFRIRDFPVFYLPYAIFPVKTKRQTGLLPPRVGYSDHNGIDVEIPFYWAISPQTDATFYERYMSERGFMQGLEFRYLTEDNSQGTFLFDILSDLIDEKNLANPDEAELSPFPRTNKTRYWFRGRADQTLPLGMEARFDADYVSDQDYLKEFTGGIFGFEARPDLRDFGRPVEEMRSPTRRSALRISRDRDEYSLQAASEYHQRPENPTIDTTPQPLGGFNFAMLPRRTPILPLFFRFETEYDTVWRDVGVDGHSLSLAPEISYPLFLGRYLALEPSFRFLSDTQWVDEDNLNIDHQTRNAYEAGARMSTSLERIFDSPWRVASKLKHKFRPTLRYQFREHKDDDKFVPWFERIDEEGDLNRITLSLDNFLDAKREDDDGRFLYNQWLFFSVSQGYDIGEARRDEEPWRDKEPWTPLSVLMTLRPLPNLDFEAQTLWNHYQETFSATDLSLRFRYDRGGGLYDTFKVDYIYAEDGTETISYDVGINLMYGFSVGTSASRDLNLDYNLNSTYWLDYQDQCWGVRLSAGRIDSIDSIALSVRLLGLGNLK